MTYSRTPTPACHPASQRRCFTISRTSYPYEELERQAKPIDLNALPLAQLKRWLDLNWKPDSTFLGPGSLTPESLIGVIQVNLATITFPGGSRFSNILVVTHTLNRVPTVVQLTAVHNNIHIAQIGVATNTNFSIQGNTIDGSLPAVGSPVNINWLVF